MTSEEIKKRKEELFGMFEPPTRSKMKAGFNKGLEFAQSKMYSEEDMINFAWYFLKNVGQYSSDENAHFEGEYLKKWKKLKKNGE